MLLYGQKRWGRQAATVVIVLTVGVAVAIPVMSHVDPPVIVGVILLLLAILPPNIAILRKGRKGAGDKGAGVCLTPPNGQ